MNLFVIKKLSMKLQVDKVINTGLNASKKG